MANTGKSTLSYRRKKSSSSTLQNDVVTKDLKIAHEATVGDSSIFFANLNTPSLLTNFTNPSLSEILSANLKGNENSLTVISSLKGALICGLSYSITNTGTQLLFEGFTAAANEIFTIQVKTMSGSATLLDIEAPIVCTGTLPAGQTDIAVAPAFQRNVNPNQQVGAVMVEIDGAIQLRNVDNVTAAPGADGNYEEVDAGNGESALIRLNETELFDRSYAVYSLGPTINTSNRAGVPQQIESLAGQIDAMTPTLALLAGVPEANFQAGPNNVDLKAFADKLFQACTDIVTNQAAQVAGDIAAGPQTDEIRGVNFSERSDSPVLSGVIPTDNTIPQISEGDEIFNITHTMVKAGNKLLIETFVTGSENSNAADQFSVAVFVDNNTDAKVATFGQQQASASSYNGGRVYQQTSEVVVGTSLNIQVRAGMNNGVSWTLNQLNRFSDVAENHGGVMNSWIKITEIEV